MSLFHRDPPAISWQSILLLSCISAIIGGIIVTSWFNLSSKNDKHELIQEYYDIENAVSISPHGLRGKMDKGDTSFILVDLRSAEEYEKEHITGAMNIPAYSDKYTSAYDDVERIVNAFRQLPSDKDIITYCYSSACMTSRKIGKMLADHGLYVKYLNIGWNEWKYHWNLWNHEHEWSQTKADQYITTGKEAGVLNTQDRIPSQCSEGGFGC